MNIPRKLISNGFAVNSKEFMSYLKDLAMSTFDENSESPLSHEEAIEIYNEIERREIAMRKVEAK